MDIIDGLKLIDTVAPLILAYDISGSTDVIFAISDSGDLTITPDGGDIVLAAQVNVTGAKLAATVFDGPIGTGAATPATGKFTALSTSGILTVNDVTNATTILSASLQTDGGFACVLDAIVGGDLDVVGDLDVFGRDIGLGDNSNNPCTFEFLANRTTANSVIANLSAVWDGTPVVRIQFRTGADTGNRDEGRVEILTAAPGGSLVKALSIDENQKVAFTADATIAGNIGFFGQAATAKPTGVTEDAASIRAALITLNLIAA